MKTSVFLACLWVCGVSMSALGATITITPHNGGDGWLLLDYAVDEAGVSPAAIGLTISLSHGATVAKSGDWTVDPAFNFFPDYAYHHPWDYQLGMGNPFGADQFPISNFGVSMSILDSHPCGFGSCEGDIDRDGMVDLNDAMILASDWLMAGEHLMSDLNGDRKVNLGDAAMLNGSRSPVGGGKNFLTLKVADGGAGFTDVTLGINSRDGGAFAADGTAFDIVLPSSYRLVIPEPATLGLLGLGAVLIRRRGR